MFLFRVHVQIVEFGLRGLNVVVARSLKAAQRTPTEGTKGVKGLGVGGPGARFLARGHQSQQAAGLKLFLDGVLNGRQVQNGGCQAEGLHGSRDSPRRQSSRRRRLDDERHMHGRVIDKKTVFGLAMFAQRFAVVAHKNDQRVLIQSALFHPAEDPPQLVVHVGYFSIIGTSPVPGAVGLRGIVGAVRIEQVKPKKKRLVGVGEVVQPFKGLVHTLFGLPIN